MVSMKSRRPRSGGRAKEEIRRLIGEIGRFTMLGSVQASIFRKHGVKMSISTVGRIKKEIISERVTAPPCDDSVAVDDSVVEPSVADDGGLLIDWDGYSFDCD